MATSCCGQPTRQFRASERRALPPNPTVRDGVRIFYVGTGTRTVRGAATGLEYTVDAARRLFTVHRDDANAVLRRRHFILAPDK
jgi:hypothetical protein